MLKQLKNRGFTLIELLVVISIIGILVAIGAVSYQKTAQLSRDSKRKGDLEQVRQALETYRSENGTYAEGSGINIPLSDGPLGVVLEPNYIRNLPEDPKSSYNYRYIVPAPGTAPIEYSLCAYLEIDPSAPLNRCTGGSCGGGPPCNYEVTNP